MLVNGLNPVIVVICLMVAPEFDIELSAILPIAGLVIPSLYPNRLVRVGLALVVCVPEPMLVFAKPLKD